MNRIAAVPWLAIIAVMAASCASVKDTHSGRPTVVALKDLWGDTPATRALSYSWRIYRRQELANHLHEQLRLYFVNPGGWRSSDRRPAIVFVHGGGWGAGNPDQWFSQSRYFALRGLVAASVQYRLKSETVGIADCLADCKSAIRYLRCHATELGINPDKIVVVGESAGGHLAAALGTITEFNHPEDNLDIPAVPNILVLLNPITDLTTRWGEGLGDKAMALSPLHHISRRTPPTLLMHGDVDRVVDLRHSQAFHERMVELGRPSRLIVLPGADHAFAVFKYGPDAFVSRTVVEIDRFLAGQGYLHGQPCLKEQTR